MFVESFDPVEDVGSAVIWDSRPLFLGRKQKPRILMHEIAKRSGRLTDDELAHVYFYFTASVGAYEGAQEFWHWFVVHQEKDITKREQKLVDRFINHKRIFSRFIDSQ